MQQQTDFQAQAAAAAATTLAAQQQATATTLAVQQQMRELVNSAVTCLPVTNARLQRARDRIRDRSSRVESTHVGINPTQLATLVTLYSCLHPTPEIAEAESNQGSR